MKKTVLAMVVVGSALLTQALGSSTVYAAEDSLTPKHVIEVDGKRAYNDASRLGSFLDKVAASIKPGDSQGRQHAAEARFRKLSRNLDQLFAIDESSMTDADKANLKQLLYKIVPLMGGIYQRAQTLGYSKITAGIGALQAKYTRPASAKGMKVLGLTIDLTTGEIS